MPNRPLVFLDVDGVINHIEANNMLNRLSGPLDDRARRLGVDIVQVRGRRMAVPHHIPALIRRLADTTEVWWCTTWRAKANGELTGHLGVAPFPVLDPNGREVGTQWKARKVEAVLGAQSNRPAFWIEDFAGAFPAVEGVEFIDTAADSHLQESHLPERLIGKGVVRDC